MKEERGEYQYDNRTADDKAFEDRFNKEEQDFYDSYLQRMVDKSVAEGLLPEGFVAKHIPRRPTLVRKNVEGDKGENDKQRDNRAADDKHKAFRA